MKKIIIFLLALSVMAACKNGTDKNISKTDTAGTIKKAAPKYDLAMMDVKKDLACGMPLTAGIGDTCHYMGKVYGFCSKECKNEFVKNPGAYLAAK